MPHPGECRSPDWPEALRRELEANRLNGAVGRQLVSESERVRVWSLTLQPGERIGFHRHVLDCFWTMLTDGKALSRYGDGRRAETPLPIDDGLRHQGARGRRAADKIQRCSCQCAVVVFS